MTEKEDKEREETKEVLKYYKKCLQCTKCQRLYGSDIKEKNNKDTCPICIEEGKRKTPTLSTDKQI